VNDDPFVQLERSHRRLEERLDDLARATSGQGDKLIDVELVRDVAGFFDRAVRRHESDEEASLFPKLAGRADLAPVLERLAREHREHESLHARLATLARDLDPKDDAARREIESLCDELTRAYRTHIDVEERELFPAARAALDADAIATISREMQARRGRGPA
jgi:hemerythrin-like domain-containing protein